MTSFIRYGCASCRTEALMIAASATATYRLYGRRYLRSRRINRASYAFPSTSSSWIDISRGIYRTVARYRSAAPANLPLPFTLCHSLARLQLLFEQLLSIERRVRSTAEHELVVMSALDDAAVIEDEDDVCLAHGRNPVR